MFELNETEVEFLVSQSVIPSKRGLMQPPESKKRPIGFVHGAEDDAEK